MISFLLITYIEQNINLPNNYSFLRMFNANRKFSFVFYFLKSLPERYLFSFVLIKLILKRLNIILFYCLIRVSKSISDKDTLMNKKYVKTL